MMLREIDLLRLLLSSHKEWEKNPEAFLELTILVSSIDCRCIQSGEVNFEEIMGPKLDNVARIFMTVLPIHLEPYVDFDDLKRNGQPSNQLSEMLVTVLESIENGVAIAQSFFNDQEVEDLLDKLSPYITTVED